MNQSLLWQRVVAGVLLVLGLSGSILVFSALTAPLPGRSQAIEGTPLADSSATVLPSGFDAEPIDGPSTGGHEGRSRGADAVPLSAGSAGQCARIDPETFQDR